MASEGNTTTITIPPEELRRRLERAVRENSGQVRDTASQYMLDRAISACLAEGEIELGYALHVLMALRIVGHGNAALTALLQAYVDIRTSARGARPAEGGPRHG